MEKQKKMDDDIYFHCHSKRVVRMVLFVPKNQPCHLEAVLEQPKDSVSSD